MNRARWSQRARAYADSVSISAEDVHFSPWLPGDSTFGLIGPVEGRMVLELGCGAGQNLLSLVRRGATVVGVDYAATQIGLATRTLAAVHGLHARLLELDYTEPLPAELMQRFDCVLSSLSFNFASPIELVFENARAALRPAGHLVFSVFHPDWIAYHVRDSGVLRHGRVCCDWWQGGYKLTVLDIEPTIAVLEQAGFRSIQVLEPLVVPSEALKAPYRFLPEERFRDEIELAGKIRSCAILHASAKG